MSTAVASVASELVDLKGLEVSVTTAKDEVTEEVLENLELVPSSGQDVMVFARTPDEMARAQVALISWADRKLAKIKSELAIAEQNLAEAKEAKIRTASWKREVAKHKREYRYYFKVKTALEEGYFIVPDFPINIIGVRTNATEPADQSDQRWPGAISNNDHDELPLGEGEYKDPVPQSHKVNRLIYNKDKKEDEEVVRWTTENSLLQDMDFPFRLIRPHLLKDLKKAMEHKIFDAIGVLPNTRRARDPMVVGVIETAKKRMLFLISWWIPTQDL